MQHTSQNLSNRQENSSAISAPVESVLARWQVPTAAKELEVNEDL